MRMVDLIVAKRSGKEHTREEIEFIIKNLDNQTAIKDYQLSAWLMAVCWQGMTLDETALLTEAMARSGEILDLSSIGPVVADKHSTGGVGDKTTLVFTPLFAAAGIPMAKLSGRGLGHSGGTIDKLEAIPGFQTELSMDRFLSQVKEIGCAIGAQTKELAPADGRIYALRDVTGTVESVPLIAASVVSKKIAAGSNLIILDVKCGAGAFMATAEEAMRLAQTMVEVGMRLNRQITAVVTDMEQPLGHAVGHTLEVMEAIDTLRGQGPDDLKELCLYLGAHALVRTGKYADTESARRKLEDAIASGAALAKFRQLISAQGGNPDVIDKSELMPQAKLRKTVVAPGAGPKWVKHLNGRLVAEACKLMGAGRASKGDTINLATGVLLHAKMGSAVKGGDALATIYGDTEDHLQLAEEKLTKAFTITDSPVPLPPLILGTVG